MEQGNEQSHVCFYKVKTMIEHLIRIDDYGRSFAGKGWRHKTQDLGWPSLERSQVENPEEVMRPTPRAILEWEKWLCYWFTDLTNDVLATVLSI